MKFSGSCLHPKSNNTTPFSGCSIKKLNAGISHSSPSLAKDDIASAGPLSLEESSMEIETLALGVGGAGSGVHGYSEGKGGRSAGLSGV